jgi:hypothetical protein
MVTRRINKAVLSQSVSGSVRASQSDGRGSPARILSGSHSARRDGPSDLQTCPYITGAYSFWAAGSQWKEVLSTRSAE